MTTFKSYLVRDIEQLESNLDAIKEDAEFQAQFDAAAEMMVETINRGGKILLCGNGGSAADAQHIAAEFVGRYEGERRALAAIALTTDTSALTAISNDYGYEDVFARQVQGLGRAGDLLIAISTSGNSRSIIKAIRSAKALKMHTLGLTGLTGGDMCDEPDVILKVPAKRTSKIQECHILLLHSLCGCVDMALKS